jgi:ATP-binding cassette subfamily A (ABC1) protein 1
LVTLGLLFPIAAGIRGIVLEKELRQKELMKMMSISESDIGWSWFLSLFMVNAITAVICAIFTNLVYSNSTFIVLLIFWIVTFVACICYCMAIAAISAKSTR